MKKSTLTSVFAIVIAFNSVAQDNVDIFKLNFPSTKSYEQGKPLLSPVGDELYFVSSYQNTEDKFISQNIWKTKWTEKLNALEPKLIKELSNRDNNAIVGFDAKTNEAYLLGTYSKKENLKKGVSAASISDGAFSKPEEQKIRSTMIKGDLYDFHKPNNSDVMFLALPDRNNVISIYISFFEENQSWSKPNLLSQVSTKLNSEISPYYNEEEGYLFFASDREGGIGGMDIYQSKKEDDTWMNWSDPELLPEPINSKSFDAYYASYGGKGSFLVSTRQDSLSSIYYLKQKLSKASPEYVIDENFKTANAPSVFEYEGNTRPNAILKLYDSNGNFVEQTVTDEKGEFVFNKLDGDKTYIVKYLTEDGNFDPNNAKLSPFEANKFSKLKPIIESMQKEGMTNADLVSGVFKYDKLPKSGVEVVLLDADGNILSKTYTDENGYYEFTNLDPDKIYLVKYNDEDHELDPSKLEVTPFKKTPKEPIAETVKPTTVEPIKPAVAEAKEIEPMESPSAPIEAANMKLLVHFETAKNEAKEDDWQIVKEQLMGLDKEIRIRLNGHADNVGSETSNQKLALERAEYVKTKLVSLGFKSSMISTASAGESSPIATNSTPEGRAKNRRVEIEIR